MDAKTQQLIENRLLPAAEDFCYTVEKCTEYDRNEFVGKMTEVLPVLYAATAALHIIPAGDYGPDVSFDYLDEHSYEAIRGKLSVLMGEFDTFLETFEQDMKYSDTPITSTVSECLADIFQPVYNFLCAYKDAGQERAEEIAMNLSDTFVEYWSQTLCNVMRPLNAYRYDIHN